MPTMRTANLLGTWMREYTPKDGSYKSNSDATCISLQSAHCRQTTQLLRDITLLQDRRKPGFVSHILRISGSHCRPSSHAVRMRSCLLVSMATTGEKLSPRHILCFLVGRPNECECIRIQRLLKLAFREYCCLRFARSLIFASE